MCTSDKGLSMRGQLHLYLQKCGWPRRLWPGCLPPGSSAAARPLPGFCPPLPEAQTVECEDKETILQAVCRPCFTLGMTQRLRWFNQRRFISFVSHRVLAWSLSLFLPFLNHSERRNLTLSPQSTSVWPAVMSRSPWSKARGYLDILMFAGFLNSRAVIWVKIDQNLIYSTDLPVIALIQTLQGGNWLEMLR